MEGVTTVHIRRKLAASALAAVGAVLLAPGVASAHAERDVGPITMAVGFGTEPDAYAGLPNSVQVILSRGEKPVLDLGDDLQVTVEFGGETSEPMTLEPFFEIGEFGTPGDYRAFFVPSQPGTYTFHFTGSVEGTKVNESFTSGPKTFAEVQDLSSATFPTVNAPTTTDLATRVDQEASRTHHAVAAAQDAATSAGDDASNATTVGIVGIVVGAIGVILGAAGLARRGRS
jgi:hypothetical protein